MKLVIIEIPRGHLPFNKSPYTQICILPNFSITQLEVLIFFQLGKIYNFPYDKPLDLPLDRLIKDLLNIL